MSSAHDDAAASPSNAVLLQMLRDYQKVGEDDHKRLRGDIMDLETVAQRHDASISSMGRDIDRIDRRPTDISAMVMSSKQVIAVIVCCLGIAAGIWTVKGDVHDVKQQIEVESARRQEQLDELKREIKLYEAKTDNVEKALIAKGVIR